MSKRALKHDDHVWLRLRDRSEDNPEWTVGRVNTFPEDGEIVVFEVIGTQEWTSGDEITEIGPCLGKQPGPPVTADQLETALPLLGEAFAKAFQAAACETARQMAEEYVRADRLMKAQVCGRADCPFREPLAADPATGES